MEKCHDEDFPDVLSAGEAIVVSNLVELPRDIKDIFYDGGDKIISSGPIKVTRGAFPDTPDRDSNGPGPLMAGTVEVAESSTWGKEFVRNSLFAFLINY